MIDTDDIIDAFENVAFIERMGPELVGAGLVKNESWVETNGRAAEAMFSDKSLKIAAVIIAAVHPYGLDYLKQAPVLAVAAARPEGTRPSMARWRLTVQMSSIKNRRVVAREWAHILGQGPKLKALLDTFEIAIQLRTLSGSILRNDDLEILKRLSGLPPSVLAQAIPLTPIMQRAWLSSCDDWAQKMYRLCNDASMYFEWAARNLNLHTYWTADVADFAAAPDGGFSTSWSLSRAIRESEAWHDKVARMNGQQQFFARHGFEWDQPVDYDPLPTRMKIGDIEFVALQSGESLFEEGNYMHHCVGTYADAVVAGRSRIFSLRRGDQRVATMELEPSPSGFRRVQMEGRFRVVPPRDVYEVANHFVRVVNKVDRHGWPE